MSYEWLREHLKYSIPFIYQHFYSLAWMKKALLLQHFLIAPASPFCLNLLSFSVDRTLWFRAMTAQLGSFEPQWSFMELHCERSYESLADKKPVRQVGNWCTGHARLCEEKNEGLREWWRLKVGGVRQGRGKADLPVAVWMKVSDKHTAEWKGEKKEGGE